jgi:hypothetical protein
MRYSLRQLVKGDLLPDVLIILVRGPMLYAALSAFDGGQAVLDVLDASVVSPAKLAEFVTEPFQVFQDQIFHVVGHGVGSFSASVADAAVRCLLTVHPARAETPGHTRVATLHPVVHRNPVKAHQMSLPQQISNIFRRL